MKVQTFEEIPNSEIGLIVDSSGLLSISMNGRSASEELQLYEGQQVELTPVKDDRSNSSPVILRKQR